MCDPTAKFGAPMPILGLGMIDGGVSRLSADELTIYFAANPGELWVAHRNTLEEAFGMPTLITAQNSAFPEWNPAVSFDGLTL